MRQLVLQQMKFILNHRAVGDQRLDAEDAAEDRHEIGNARHVRAGLDDHLDGLRPLDLQQLIHHVQRAGVEVDDRGVYSFTDPGVVGQEPAAVVPGREQHGCVTLRRTVVPGVQMPKG